MYPVCSPWEKKNKYITLTNSIRWCPGKSEGLNRRQKISVHVSVHVKIYKTKSYDV